MLRQYDHFIQCLGLFKVLRYPILKSGCYKNLRGERRELSAVRPLLLINRVGLPEFTRICYNILKFLLGIQGHLLIHNYMQLCCPKCDCPRSLQTKSMRKRRMSTKTWMKMCKQKVLCVCVCVCLFLLTSSIVYYSFPFPHPPPFSLSSPSFPSLPSLSISPPPSSLLPPPSSLLLPPSSLLPPPSSLLPPLYLFLLRPLISHRERSKRRVSEARPCGNVQAQEGVPGVMGETPSHCCPLCLPGDTEERVFWTPWTKWYRT